LPLRKQVAKYQLAFRESAAKELRGLPLGLKIRIEEAVESIREEPRKAGVRKLKGYSHSYRIRVGDYRVVYEILDEQHRIVVTKVRHRKDVYD
jgi:mRNA interferase RelE/StbE